MLNGERLSLHEATKGRFQGISCAYLNSSDKLITVYEGFADKESSIPVDENTIFPACSISKFITALCVMKANEKKMIDIDAPVNNYLSKWKLCTASGNKSDVSIRMVLCHVAGIVDGEDAFYGLRRTDPAIGLMDILEGRTSYNNRPVHVEKAPGTEFEYSDASYCVLQLLLKETTGKLFEDIAKEYIFDPLGLKQTFFASQENVAFYEKNYVMATGYDENGLPIPEKYPQIPDLAASGLWSTPKELLIIARNFVNACNGNSSLLKNKTAHEMVKPVERFPWSGIGLFMGGENEVISRGWGENGQSMLKINYRTGEIAAVMTNQNPGVDQTESGLEGLVNNTWETYKVTSN